MDRSNNERIVKDLMRKGGGAGAIHHADIASESHFFIKDTMPNYSKKTIAIMVQFYKVDLRNGWERL